MPHTRTAWLRIGATLGFLAVALGAFGAHGLKSRVTPERLQVFETGVRYQLFHVLALLALVMPVRDPLPAAVRRPAIGFFVGIVLFSGSLYALVLLDLGKLGMITPFGGIAFLVGWFMLLKDPPERSLQDL